MFLKIENKNYIQMTSQFYLNFLKLKKKKERGESTLILTHWAWSNLVGPISPYKIGGAFQSFYGQG